MDDYISRQAAIDAINDMFAKSLARDRATAAINGVHAEARWIPCSERLPDNIDYVLCTTERKNGKRGVVRGYYSPAEPGGLGTWVCGMNTNVIAWMPLPEPYKGEIK